MTITFPVQQSWIPNVDQLTDTGATLLAVAGGALDQQGVGETYARRLFAHGGTIPWKMPQGANRGQLLISATQMNLGRAGEEQFQFASGALGKYMFLVARYTVEVVNEWPTPKGGPAPQLARDDAIMEATRVLWRDAVIVYSALRALALGGITTTPPAAPIAQDNILVGPMNPKGPQGQYAGWAVDVIVQF